jgi:hypothetical protein
MSCFLMAAGLIIVVGAANCMAESAGASHGGGGRKSAGSCIPFNEELKIRAASANYLAASSMHKVAAPEGTKKYAFFP